MAIKEIDEVDATDNFAIGIAFGNSNSSIAFTSAVCGPCLCLSHVYEV